MASDDEVSLDEKENDDGFQEFENEDADLDQDDVPEDSGNQMEDGPENGEEKESWWIDPTICTSGNPSLNTKKRQRNASSGVWKNVLFLRKNHPVFQSQLPHSDSFTHRCAVRDCVQPFLCVNKRREQIAGPSATIS